MLLTLYKILWWLVLPWVLFFRFFKDKSSGQPWRYLFERLGYGRSTYAHDVMLHAVSLGEMRAMTPLVFEILQQHPKLSILITTTTLTGKAQAIQTFGDQVSVAFLPHDIGYFIRRFLSIVNPKILMIMETEIWPNLLDSCQKLKVPTYIISACLSERSQKGYLKIPKTIQQLLENVHVMTQSEEDRQRFLTIGASNVAVMGNLKYYTVLPNDFMIQVEELMIGKASNVLWCLASSHDDEESQILEQFMALKKHHSNLKLAIAPRHPERFDTVEQLIQSKGLAYQKRSDAPSKSMSFNHCDVWLWNTIGELLYLYGTSDIITVGGSFIPIGGHNILEPAFLRKAITVGPYIDNIQDMVEAFKEKEAIIVLSSDKYQKDIQLLLENKVLREKMAQNAYECVMSNQKALTIVMKAFTHCIKGS